MNILQITAASICISVVALAVKSMNSEMGQLISIAAVVAVAAAIVPYITAIVASMKEFAAYSSVGGKYLEPVMKITGIAYISRIGAQLCEDSGEKALSGRVEAAGKIAVTVIALPIAGEAFEKIMGILS